MTTQIDVVDIQYEYGDEVLYMCTAGVVPSIGAKFMGAENPDTRFRYRDLVVKDVIWRFEGIMNRMIGNSKIPYSAMRVHVVLGKHGDEAWPPESLVYRVACALYGASGGEWFDDPNEVSQEVRSRFFEMARVVLGADRPACPVY